MKRYITSEKKVASKYMAQVQLQMHLSNKQRALFCVANYDFESSRKVSIINIQYDKQYCENLLEQCTQFWIKSIFPVVIKSINVKN